MTEPKFANHADAKKANWSSRRNESPAAQSKARQDYFTKSSRNVAKAKRKGMFKS